ncbi:MAG: M28 family peptidase [Caulobacteraceae bacterium]|nr:M28 family peptidase [Caulobacteraceae bacterium]
MIRKFSVLAAVAALAAGASAFAAPYVPQLSAQRLSEDTRMLSSDAFEGRGPSSPGEDKAIAYIARQMQAAGLEPGGPDGSWYQDVLVRRFSQDGTPQMSFRGADGAVVPVAFGSQAVVGSKQLNEHVQIANAPLVFVGYGIHAPERGWDDYAGLDLHGKIAVVLINDADFEEPELNTFNGKAMTYYGRWTYKFEEAARQGAAGVLIVHEDKPASYTWATVEGSWSVLPQFDVMRDHPERDWAPLQGWIQRDVAVDLFRRAGLNFDELKARARVKGFRAVPINATFSADFRQKVETITTHNVVGVLKGGKRPNETILYTAHWDHLGVGKPDANGDNIYNGALDNASGTAGLLEIARAFGAGPRPDRSVVFIAYTLEEKGLLGSEYYATHPVFPLATTVAGFNMDGLQVDGPTRDINVVGYGQSDLEDALVAVARTQNRVVKPEGHPESGSFFRSDHFPLAKRGVPMLYAGSGSDLVNGGVEAGEAAGRDYNRNRYHQPDDEWNPNWDWSGAILDLTINYTIGRDLAFSNRWPQWRDGSEFKPERDKTASQRH